MKKIYLLSTLVAGLLAFNSCNHEPDFPGLGEASQIKNVAKYVTSYAGATFSESNPAKNTLPAWLDAKYKTVDKGSTATVDYKYTISTPDYITALAATKPYTLVEADYLEVWGEGSTFNYFSPSKPAKTLMPTVLGKAIAEPAEGDMLAVTYNEAETDGALTAFKEDFESGTNRVDIDYNDWLNVTVTGTYLWQTRNYFSTLHAQQSANAHAAGQLDSYLISKEFTVGNGMVLTFDAVYVYYVAAGGRVKVLLTTNLLGSTSSEVQATSWTDITSSFTIPATGEFANAGSHDLSSYAGQKIRIAFRYEGDSNTSATSTIRIDNVVVKDPNEVAATYVPKNALYQHTEGTWKLYEEAYILQPTDYTAMGIEYLSAMSAQSYLPSFLAYKYPLVIPNTIKAVVFKQADNTFMAAEFQKTITHWQTTGGTTELSDEYEYDGKNWQYVRTVPKAALNMTFDDRAVTDKAKTEIENWLNVASIGTDYWKDRKYNANIYVEATAYNSISADKVELWLITPALEIKNDYILTFDMVSGHWTHQALEVYVSSSFSGKAEDVPVVYTEDDKDEALAQSGKEVSGWKRLTDSFDFPVKVGGYSPFKNVEKASLNDYAGQTVYIGFRYWGNKMIGLTSTVQIDNIYVGE